MSNLAKLTHDGSKLIAMFHGHVVASSASRDYVVMNIRNGKCRKAVELGVTDVESSVNTLEVDAPILEERFSINERFGFVTDLVNMVCLKTIPSVIITGEGGLGKTHTVMQALRAAGLKDTRDFLVNFEPDEDGKMPIHRQGDYSVVKGFSTAKGLYRTLYENREKIVVFDDCDSILKDPVATSLLKGALDSYDERWISWNAEAIFGDGLPRSFKFTGQIVFISNMPMMKIDQAIRSRSMCVDLAMTDAQKVERMSHIITEHSFMPEFDFNVKAEALNFLASHVANAREVSLRTLISITKIRAKSQNWEQLAEYVLTN